MPQTKALWLEICNKPYLMTLIYYIPKTDTKQGFITTNMLQSVLYSNENLIPPKKRTQSKASLLEISYAAYSMTKKILLHPQNGYKARLHYYKYVTKRTL
jgi:hypothetical protein